MNLSDIVLLWPVDPITYPISQLFGENPQRYAKFGLAGHNGVDLALPNGTPVMAAAAGKVIAAGTDTAGYGNYVKIEHNGYQTIYGHFRNWTVLVGQQVGAGEIIGHSDNTGNSTGPHLHFELRIPGQGTPGYKDALEPTQFIQAIPLGPSSPPLDLGNAVVDGAAPSTTSTEIISGAICQVTATDGLSLRTGKSRETSRLAIVMYNTTIKADGVDGEWAEVTITGYLNTKWLQRIG